MVQSKKISHKEMLCFILIIEDMQKKEKEHLEFLIKTKNKDKVITGIDIMIEKSKYMLDHFTNRLREYREYANKNLLEHEPKCKSKKN